MNEMKPPTEGDLAKIIDINSGRGSESMPYANAIELVNRCITTNQLQQASIILQQLADLFPNDIIPKALFLLVKVNARDHSKAVQLADEIQQHSMHDSMIQALCIRGYRQAGKIDTALDLAKKVVCSFPHNAMIQNEVGLCFLSSGDKENAIDAFNQAIESNPNFTPPYMGRARLMAGKLNSNQIEAMLEIGKNRDLSDEDRAILDFSIAWAYDGIDADRHFEFLHRANAAIAIKRPWDERLQQQRVKKTKELFCQDFVSCAKSSGPGETVPIFIVGVPRSGTSLVEQILSTHDQITGCGETGGIEKAVHITGTQLNVPTHIWDWSKTDNLEQYFTPIDQVYRSQLTAFNIKTPFFTDKSLGGEWWCGLILAMYPRAKIIHCLRHPLDSCLSMYQLHFSSGQDFTYNLRSIAKYYQHHIELMDHWKKLYPDRILTIHYEDLVEEQRLQTEKMLNFCHLTWQENCMNFHQAKRTARTASDFQIKKPLYKTSINRWVPYTKHLKEAAEILSIDTSQYSD